MVITEVGIGTIENNTTCLALHCMCNNTVKHMCIAMHMYIAYFQM